MLQAWQGKELKDLAQELPLPRQCWGLAPSLQPPPGLPPRPHRHPFHAADINLLHVFGCVDYHLPVTVCLYSRKSCFRAVIAETGYKTKGVIYVKVNKFKNIHKFEIPERPRSCFKFVQTEKKVLFSTLEAEMFFITGNLNCFYYHTSSENFILI